MGIISAVAIFFIIWWTVLFAVLPWGVRTADETGDARVGGQAESAPARPDLRRKTLWTTAITIVIFALFWANLEFGWLGLDDLPGPFRDMPQPTTSQ